MGGECRAGKADRDGRARRDSSVRSERYSSVPGWGVNGAPTGWYDATNSAARSAFLRRLKVRHAAVRRARDLHRRGEGNGSRSHRLAACTANRFAASRLKKYTPGFFPARTVRTLSSGNAEIQGSGGTPRGATFRISNGRRQSRPSRRTRRSRSRAARAPRPPPDRSANARRADRASSASSPRGARAAATDGAQHRRGTRRQRT